MSDTALHTMLPGSHKQISGPECRCGEPWNYWDSSCSSSKSTKFCPRTGVALGVCDCDDCCPEAAAVAQHRSVCGWCTGTIRAGDPIVRPAGEPRWWHPECRDAAEART